MSHVMEAGATANEPGSNRVRIEVGDDLGERTERRHPEGGVGVGTVAAGEVACGLRERTIDEFRRQLDIDGIGARFAVLSFDWLIADFERDIAERPVRPFPVNNTPGDDERVRDLQAQIDVQAETLRLREGTIDAFFDQQEKIQRILGLCDGDDLAEEIREFAERYKALNDEAKRLVNQTARIAQLQGQVESLGGEIRSLNSTLERRESEIRQLQERPFPDGCFSPAALRTNDEWHALAEEVRGWEERVVDFTAEEVRRDDSEVLTPQASPESGGNILAMERPEPAPIVGDPPPPHSGLRPGKGGSDGG